MDYTINQLAKLSGVSTRTLRYYDQIGLLKPQTVAKNGYRIYGQTQVDMLQQILFYRELAISLAQISNLIYAKDFDKANSLENHLLSLIEKKDRLECLIQNVSKSIASLKGETMMTDKEKFEGFKQHLVADNKEKYGQELKNKYGAATMTMFHDRLLSMTQNDWQMQDSLSGEIASLLQAAITIGNPSCEQAQKACDLHRQWICMFWQDGMYSKEAHQCLGETYVSDSRFQAYYENIAPGCAKFLKDALDIYCAQ